MAVFLLPQGQERMPETADIGSPTARERLTAAGFDTLLVDSHEEVLTSVVTNLSRQMSADGLEVAAQMEVMTLATERLASLGFEDLNSLLTDPIEEMLQQGAKRPTLAQQLIELVLADGIELWHDGNDGAYLTIEVDGTRDNLPVLSRKASIWLRRLFYEETGRCVPTKAIGEATALLEAQALYDGESHAVAVRLGGHEGRVYLDLANSDRQVIEIDSDGWRVVSDPPVRFRRPHGLLPLPVPVPGGSVDELRPFLNLSGPDAFVLVVGFVLGALNPQGPYPILILQGEQGSAKSTAVQLIVSTIAPSLASLRTLARDERDLAISARNSWILAYDNLSGLPDRMSDAFCRLSTGGGLATRELYTDMDEVIFDARRPVILNGIDAVAVRQDLRDRAIILTLPPLGDDSYRSEADLLKEFDEVHPSILGALLDAVSAALRERTDIDLPGPLPRMVDFAAWVTAAESALGWPPHHFLDVYMASRREAQADSISDDALASALVEFAQDQGDWSGRATELLTLINQRVPEEARGGKSWPNSPQTLGNVLTRITPDLRRLEIQVERDRSSSRRLITLRHQSSSSSSSSPRIADGAGFSNDDDDGYDDHDVEVPF